MRPKLTDPIPDAGTRLREFRTAMGWPQVCRRDAYPDEWTPSRCTGTKRRPCCLRRAFTADGKPGPSRSAIDNWENGRKQPSARTLYRIHKLFRSYRWQEWKPARRRRK